MKDRLRLLATKLVNLADRRSREWRLARWKRKAESMPDDQKVLFAVDTKTDLLARVRSPFIVAGWLIPAPENPLVGILVEVDGQLRAKATTGLRRPDVADAFPDKAGALWSGFAAEVFIDDLADREVSVEVKAVLAGGETSVDRFPARVKGFERVVSRRPTNWRYPDILACPICLGSLRETESAFQCARCERDFHKRRGTPVFRREGDVISSQLLVTNPTNPNAEEHTALIKDLSNGLVLDLGAGNPRESEHHPNVVFHESVQYAHTDVVSVCDRLPYREGAFDAVISKAAFEHMTRPWEMADEIYRVLKPGGFLTVDTAFMYPLHGAPYHFFNMTLDGAKEIFKRFNTVRCGVKPYQTPSYGLRAQMDIMLDHLRSEDWRNRVTAWRDSISQELDYALDAQGVESLAAGVFFEGTKPTNRSG
jgi:SAM-dependent methyltransferase